MAATTDTFPPGYEPHIGESRQYWRDIILGVNDGLVSIFLLAIGVVGGGLASRDILLASIAAAVAGAISMAAGEYLATKSQDEILSAELRLERTHIEKFRDWELDQLRGFFSDMGVRPEHLDGVMAAFEDNDDALLEAMAALEFGFVDKERRSPYKAMAASGLLFLAGSIPVILPYAITPDVLTATVWATVLTAVGLFLVGVVKARVSRNGVIRSGLENLVIAGLGGVGAFYLGDLLGKILAG
ncbi:MAG: VIT1/CCC1 transporter family protein [Acidimicrobiales bacterium]|nr:VIT1/CCC1 transporter family protein [Acidimicrobiales bacterium]HLV90002.1 VIT1/CCC1 transporter family protein [Acidimicrobiia bacterium]